MNLIDLSIRRPVFAWILMSALIIFGAIGLSRLGVSQLPDVDFPILDISINFEGAEPELIETEILDPIEQQLLSVEGIKEMKSSARQGSGNVRLEFEINKNVDVALQEVQSTLSRLTLPNEIDPPVIRKSNPEEDPILFLGVSSNGSKLDMIKWIDNYLFDKIRFIPDVGEVSIAGFSTRNLRVWIDPKKLKLHELTVLDILDAISSQHKESSAGQFTSHSQEVRVKWEGELLSADEFSNIRILRRGGQPVQPQTALKLKDVAKIEDGLSDLRRIARINNKDAIFISIKKQRGTNEVKISEAVREKMEKIKSEFPDGYSAQVNIDFTLPTKATVHSTLEKLVVAGLITIIICFLFLGSLNYAVNILFSIPTSILGTFIILYFSRMTLNLFTLLALTLAISIVVDDAIMLLENIVRHYRMGKSPAKAASDGSKEILPSAIAASLSVVAIFLPVIFMDGIWGKFFFQFGIAMSSAILLSLLEAVTITPMRASAFLSSSPKVTKFEEFVDHLMIRAENSYRLLLKKFINRPISVLLGSVLLFGISLNLIPVVKKELLPAQDQNIIILSAQTPPGTALDATIKKSYEIEDIIKKNPNIRGYVVSAGLGGASNSVNTIFVPIYLKAKEDRLKGHNAIMEDLRKDLITIKDAKIQMRDISARGITSGRFFPISFNLRGPDLKILKESSEKIMKELTLRSLAQDLDTDFKLGLPELRLFPKNQNELYNLGLTKEQVSRTLAASIGGLRQGRYTADGKRYDIRVKIPDEIVQSDNDIGELGVRNMFGNIIPLKNAVDMTRSGAMQSITRINRQRTVAVFGALAPGVSQGIALQEAQKIAESILPPGYTFSLEGAASGMSEAFKSLTNALLIGIIVAYMILAIQFNSFIHPIVILIALPFSITGAFLALWLSGVSLNLFSFIGIIVLMGIAKKNSILLVEYTNQVRNKTINQNKKEHITEALLQACPIRLRPILMTTMATIFAAFPLVFGNGMGSETRLPMGLTIIGGSIVSTVFTLFVVPALYSVLSRLESNKKIEL